MTKREKPWERGCLLIGLISCSKAIKPKEIIPGREDEPFMQ
jgi:hypothetical protein